VKPTGDGREQGFDRLLSREFSRPAATAEACPQAELLSAWFDRALPSAEAEAVELHVAGCARCQDVLGHLARTEPEVLYAHPKPARRPWTWHLRWAAPLTATALVVLLAGTRSLLAPDVVIPADAPASATATRQQAARSGEVPLLDAPKQEEVAPADSPQKREVAPPDAPKQNAPGLNATDLSGGALSPSFRQPATPIPADARHRAEALSETDRMARSRADAAPPPLPAPAAAPRSVPVQAQAKNAFADAAPQGRAAGEAKGAEAAREEKLAAAAPLPGVAETVVVPKEPSPTSARRALVALESVKSTEPSAFVPGSPVGWRHARPGSVMRTLDGGTTWAEHGLPDNVRLLALSAVSPSICWAAGVAGAVVRTVDGVTWRAVAAPATSDLAWIAAIDERSATVRTADGVTYDTGDGGATWRRR
jgi:hypothetical protein